jgi:polyisoprenoid-binding protein YceI
MKNTRIYSILIFALITIISLSLTLPADAAEVYEVDPAHTYVLFRVNHLGIGYSYGRLITPTGTFTVDDSSGGNGTIDVQVLAENIFTGVEKRDNHLKSPDFFNAKKFKVISFKSTSFKKVSENTYEITADITLLGKTRSVNLTAIQTGIGKDPYGSFRRGFESTFTLKRSDFGMDFMLGGVSDEVQVTISVEGIRQ